MRYTFNFLPLPIPFDRDLSTTYKQVLLYSLEAKYNQKIATI